MIPHQQYLAVSVCLCHFNWEIKGNWKFLQWQLSNIWLLGQERGQSGHIWGNGRVGHWVDHGRQRAGRQGGMGCDQDGARSLPLRLTKYNFSNNMPPILWCSLNMIMHTIWLHANIFFTGGNILPLIEISGLSITHPSAKCVPVSSDHNFFTSMQYTRPINHTEIG